MATIPDSHKDILDKRSFAHLCTLMKDGSPQASPVWIDHKDGRLIVNSAEGRVKDRNMRRDDRVAVSIVDPDNPYRALMIRGRVAEITTDGAVAHIHAMAKKYMGKDEYPWLGDDTRVIYAIEPTSVATMG